MSTMLDISMLSVRYGHVIAVDGVSLKVDDGEIVAMIGGNGAGKSSVIRAVIGAVRPEAGSMFGPGGVDLKRIPPHQVCRTGIALVPSERQVFREMTVLENLEMGAYSRRDRQAVGEDRENVLQRFPMLRERASQVAGNLSGGLQQQLSIARALMARPRLLLMDEPSLGLSPALVDQLFQLIVELNGSGLSILLIEQNAKRALQVAARAYVLRAGAVVASGASADLEHDPIVMEAYLGRMAGSRARGH